ncbi:hypothetical protein OHB05_37645 [Streptomyces sp. NBC_00638]|uniref:hypothetical protein n=1 Tax=unclassified Streptomyces TaxID=2593676 RepID=UPI00224E0D24|nr:hypothetical protein [Streptomyces sp. NBC_00638]MCX5008299.1 hypothetical protein [Streptomyces sp. NBC_00638]
MEWVAAVVSGVSAVLSLIAVVLVAKMTAHGDHEKWLREERVRSAIQLKLAVSRVRVQYSRPTGRVCPGSDALHFDFSEVNSAMAHLDLVGSPSVVSDVEGLRHRLREFVRASKDGEPEWRARRDALDVAMDRIVEIVRKDTIS